MTKRASQTPVVAAIGTLSTADLADVLGLTRQRVNQLAAEGVLVSEGRGRWQLRASVRAYLDYRRKIEAERAAGASPGRLQEARANEIELRIVKDTRALERQAIDTALAVIDKVIGGIKSDLLAVPARVTSDLGMRLRIETELTAVMAKAAQRASKEKENDG